VNVVFASFLVLACPAHDPPAVFCKRDIGHYKHDRAAPRALILLVSVVLIGRAIASVYVPIPTTRPTIVELRMRFFVIAYNVLAL
jgi:hypothetical protein